MFTLPIVATVLVYIWFIEGRGQDRQHAATAIVVGLAIWHDVKHREWGLDWTAFGRAARLTAGCTVVAVAGIFVAGLVAGTIHDRRDFLGTFLWLVVWGGAQQWVLQTRRRRFEPDEPASRRVHLGENSAHHHVLFQRIAIPS